jgi:hypothetical protein
LCRPEAARKSGAADRKRARRFSLEQLETRLAPAAIALFNTGVDNTGAPLADGAVDAHYRLITAPAGSGLGPDALVVGQSKFPFAAGYWLADGTASKWIGPAADQSAAALPDGTYVYRTTFDLTGLDPKTAAITGQWATDNTGSDILLDGQSTGFTNATEYTALAPFSITSGFQSGVNTLDFVVFNVPGPQRNPTGLRVEMSGTAGVALPVPAVTVAITGGAYNGLARGATAAAVTATGNVNLASLGDSSLSISYYAGATASGVASATPPKDAGTYTAVAHWTSNNPNYASADSSPATFVITPLPVTVTGITAKDKVYDGTTKAALNTSGATLAGVLPGDDVTLLTAAATGTFASKDVGNNIPVKIAGLALGGAQAADYTLSPAPAAKQAGVVAYWRFEEGSANNRADGTGSIVDSSGNALAGTPVNGPVYRSDVAANPLPQTGAANNLALDFFGTNQFVSVPDYPLLRLTQSLTVEAFIKLRSFQTTSPTREQQVLFRGDDRSGYDAYELEISGNSLMFRVENASDTHALVTADFTPYVGKWAHVAGSLDDATGKMSLYINGILVASTITTVRPLGNLTGALPGLGIGNTQSSTYNEHFNGLIDEVRISDRALQPSQLLGSGQASLALAASIMPARLTVSNIKAANKVYDATIKASLTTTGAALVGVVAGDNVTLNLAGVSGTFASKDVGNNIAVAVAGAAIGGAQAGDYTVTQPTPTANITPQSLTVAAAANTKVFDGATSAAAVPTITLGSLHGSDTANFSETYDTAAVGTAKKLTPAGAVSDGNGGNNYTYNFVAANTGVISAARYAVTLVDGNSVTAGIPFLFTVQAVDATGNPVTSYTGPASIAITSTPADSQGKLPASAALNSAGFGFFLGTLKTAAAYVLTATGGSFVGSSSQITVKPAAASYFKVTAPDTALTGSPVGVSVAAFDIFGNSAPAYSGKVHFTSSDARATLPPDLTLSAGAGRAIVTLGSAGSQTITATDATAVSPLITGTSSTIVTRGLTVTSLTLNPTGFTATFSKPLLADKLALYGPGLQTVPDVTLVGASSGPIAGSLIIDPSNLSVTFHATASAMLLANNFASPALPDDTYTLTLVSGSGTHGFMDALGAGLDGAGSGGHANYTTTFTTHYQAAATPVLSIPDFARGPDGSHAVKAPNDKGFGIPVTLYNAANVTDVTFTLSYNPSLLNVTGSFSRTTSDATDPAGSFIMAGPTLIDASHATANFHFHDNTPQSSTMVLGDIQATVPNAAANYKAKDLLQITSVVINSAATQPAAGAFTPLDDPVAAKGTVASGASGGSVVGYYVDNNTISHGFLYNGSTFVRLDDPLAARGTAAQGISGSNIVGYYYDLNSVLHGFRYNGATYTTLDDPLGVKGTEALGAWGSQVVGWYRDASLVQHGFLYNGSTYTTLNDPLGTKGTVAAGIDGSTIVGTYYDDNSVGHGFLYNGSTYTTLDDPLGAKGTTLLGIAGGNIVGSYVDANSVTHGFVYSGAVFTTLDNALAAKGSVAAGIAGSTIVGYYFDKNSVAHSFLFQKDAATIAAFRFEEGSGTSISDSVDGLVAGSTNAAFSTSVPPSLNAAAGATNQYSLSLTSTSSAVISGQPFLFNQGFGDGTLDFWVKLPTPSSAGDLFWTRTGATDSNRFNLEVDPLSGKIYLAFDYREPGGTLHSLMPGTPSGAPGPFQISPNTWTRVTITRSGNTYRFYRDNALVYTATDVNPRLPNLSAWTLGGRPGLPFVGNVDEIRFLNGAVAPSQFVPATGLGGVHVNAYLGDVTGNGTIDGLDVAAMRNMAQGNDTGFAAYQLLDPAIVGDPAADLSVDAGDVSAVAAFTARLPAAVIPALPTGLTITPVGADPTLSLGDLGRIANPSHASVVSVPVLLDHTHPDGSAGLTEAVVALTYDPSVLAVSAADITLGSIPGLGAGWQLKAEVDEASGQIGIELYSTTPITKDEAGSLVSVAFHVLPGASVPATAVQLVSAALVHGHYFATQVDDDQGELVLGTGVSRQLIPITPRRPHIVAKSDGRSFADRRTL